MKRVENAEELRALRDKLKDKLGIRHDTPDNIHVVVGTGTYGIAAGARPVLSAITKEVGKLNLQNVTVAHKAMDAECEFAPIVEVIEPGKDTVTYVKMDEAKAVKVINEHVAGGTPVGEYVKE